MAQAILLQSWGFKPEIENFEYEEMTFLRSEVEKLKSARVLCIGDVMLDRYVHGAVRRVSPEAPVPVVEVEHSRTMPGGAGNVARNAASLGAKCVLVAVTGNDVAGREIASSLQSLRNLTLIGLVDSERQTTVKTRFVAAGQQVLRVDEEVVTPLSAGLAEKVIEAAAKALPQVDVVVLSDYAKGTLTTEVTSAIISAARSKRVPVIVDPKGRDYSKYNGASLLTPNLAELRAATGMDVNTDEEVQNAVEFLFNRTTIGAVLVTRSERGVSYMRRSCPAVHIPTTAQEVFDVSGAGDTIVATLAVATAVGVEPTLAARMANIAAGVVVGKLDTATVEHRELIAAGRRDERGKLLNKLSEADAASALAEEWRSEGRYVGFTNGCFDLVHPGHVSLLTQAAGKCDRLIVGLNGDESVRRLKGPERPIQDELSRALVLGAFPEVDAIVIFDEDTPEGLIRKLRPDVLIKGADYETSQIAGAEFVQSYGGAVYLAALTPDHSTTRMVRRLQKSDPENV